MESFQSLAFGLDLEVTPVSEGGRSAPIDTSGVNSDYRYRPNWGLPEMVPTDQTGAPVWHFSSDVVNPGDRVKAVIVVPYPMTVDDWNLQVDIGSRLPMYEGSRVCGVGTVLWKRSVEVPLNNVDRAEFSSWLGRTRS